MIGREICRINGREILRPFIREICRISKRGSMEPITPQPGNAQSAKTFVGRKGMTTRAETRLLNGENLLLTDPRRMGKTQWLRHLERTTVAFTPVFINYESARTSDELFEKTADALVHAARLPKRFLDGLLQFLKPIEGASAMGVSLDLRVGGTAAQRLQNLITTLNDETASDSGRPVLLLIDELPLAIRNITENQSPEEARIVLQTLRALRSSAPNVRWILCGSIGLHHVVTQCGATKGDFNDLQSIPLGPLEKTEADELSERLLLGAGCVSPSPAAIAELRERCGRIPFLMHKIAQMIGERSTSEATPDLIVDVFQGFLDDRDESGAVTHFVERFDVNYGEDRDEAMGILDRVAMDESVVVTQILNHESGRNARARLIDLLVDDHYLIESSGVLTWRYPVLKRIWLQRRKLT
ncbi:hypothetical protein ACIP5T_16565 [Microbacterium sp. NPDC088619]|uniref:hypothetical protein n=1 Tax=Microbacterium sp. NPDC088619 TaxID=3364196 RepID=UPI00380880FE